ncbi:MAG: hypothetical protein IJK28_08240 [Clostridia bacterium]|nr:hypothetical protein [Clostridia bacterium]
MKTPLTAERLRQHLRYGWWKYVLSLALILSLSSILFTMTAPRPAEDQKIEMLVYGATREDALNAYLEWVRQERFPEQELFSASVYTDAASGIAGMATRIFAGDGDIFLLPEDTFKGYADQGILVPLDSVPEVMDALQAYGIPTDRGNALGPDGQPYLFGISVTCLPVMESWLVDRSVDRYLCIRVRNGNDETAKRLLIQMLKDLHSLDGMVIPESITASP